jgi:2-polyprenyl-3-methyl-5-hydroxy-6-metoxy-1,4-benzoquinol methylase
VPDAVSRTKPESTGIEGRKTCDEKRFGFGRNWRLFVDRLTNEQIGQAEDSLREMLGVRDLGGVTFLDVGCGSGLFSLAAARLGATRVHSFDFDPESVESAKGLKGRSLPDSALWTIERGSVLDETYLAGLGAWDVVYAWGVLHHTGAMWAAIRNVQALLRPGGRLFLAIYNDQGLRSRVWRRIKRFYNRGPVARALVLIAGLPVLATGAAARDLLTGRNPLRRYSGLHRGMTPLRDWVDLLGGYPFEFARPDEIRTYFRDRGFLLERERTVGEKLGCNEFVFRR